MVSNYDLVFEHALQALDPSLKTLKSKSVAWIYDFELTHGAKELLLRGNFGRYAAPPLIRTALEVAVIRTLLDIKKSTKYKDKEIVIKKELHLLDNLLRAADSIGLKLTLDSETIRRLYEWGNVVVHLARRMPHEEVWHSLVLASVVGEADKSQAVSKIDSLLEKLQSEEIIEIA